MAATLSKVKTIKGPSCAQHADHLAHQPTPPVTQVVSFLSTFCSIPKRSRTVSRTSRASP